MISKRIYPVFGPYNLTFSDLLFTVMGLFFQKSYANKFKNELLKKIRANHIYLTGNARTALYLLLKENLEEGSQVLVPSFTCSVVANSVISAKMNPIYMDVNLETYNSDFENLEKYLTSNVKAIIVQHTFGNKVNVEEILKFLKKISREDVIIIEDMAHTLEIPLTGHFGILSFGLEKCITTIEGGAIVSNEKINFKNKLRATNLLLIYLNLIFWYFGKILDYVNFDRLYLGLKIKIFLSKYISSPVIYEANPETFYPKAFSNSLSALGLNQLKKYNSTLEYRKKTVSILLSKLEIRNVARYFLRLPIVVKGETVNEFWEKMFDKGIICGVWFNTPLFLNGINKDSYFKINNSQIPNTNILCKSILNLPTNIPHHLAENLTF